MDNVRDIINGTQLPRFINKKVSIIGKVISVHPNGLSFDLQAVDDVVVKINLQRPVDKPLGEGYVEVRGTSNGKMIMAEDFVIFTNENFDTKAHNTLCSLLYSVPNIWATS